MGYNFRRSGFTIVELVVVMIIMGVLASSGAYLMFHYVKNAVYIPNKLNMDMLVSSALDLIIDGDNQAKGLRFSKSITSINTPNPDQVTFINQDDQTVSYWITSGKLYRSINGAAGAIIPYYASASAISMSPKTSALFSFYDANSAITSTAANIRWIIIGLVAKTGSGLYADWQGQSAQSTSISVPKFQ